MCGRFTNTAGPEELTKKLGDALGVQITESAGTGRYNVAPGQDVLAIVSPDGHPQARMLFWGLIPPWAKDKKIGYNTKNAQLETVTERASYRALIPKATRRALLIADGYYEWIKPEKKAGKPQPFLFRVDGGEPFAFAGLWTPANVGGEHIESCTMLTCKSNPNAVVHAIHHRMPVILPDAETRRAWLDPSLDTQEALSLCGALPANRMTVNPANPDVNKVGAVAEGAELLVAPPRMTP